MVNEIKISWSLNAVNSLEEIFNFYKHKSERGALKVINDIYNSPSLIRFPKQFQMDELNPKYRRIIVRDYKVLYREEKNNIVIVDVVCTLMKSKNK